MRLRMLFYKACAVYKLATLADKVFVALVRKYKAVIDEYYKELEEKHS